METHDMTITADASACPFHGIEKAMIVYGQDYSVHSDIRL